MGLGAIRTQIRAELLSALSGVTDGRIVSGEEEPEMALPNIVHNITIESLDIRGSSMVSGSDPSFRDIQIEIDGRALLVDGSDVPIDDLSLEIEKAIATASTLNALIYDLRLSSTDNEIDEQEDKLGHAKLIYYGSYEE